jgi:hypothetical protein
MIWVAAGFQQTPGERGAEPHPEGSAPFTVNRPKQASPVRTNFEMHSFCAVVARGKMEIRAEVRPRNVRSFHARRRERERFRANRMHRIGESRADKL